MSRKHNAEFTEFVIIKVPVRQVVKITVAVCVTITVMKAVDRAFSDTGLYKSLYGKLHEKAEQLKDAAEEFSDGG